MTDLLPFQREDVRQIYRFGGRALVANDMGTGKTLEALYWLSKIPKHRPAIIICPASMKYTWQAEAHLHFGMHIDVLEGNCNGDTFLPGKIVVLNYDILGTWLPLLLKSKPKCVILDECQRIKSLKARRTHHAFKLCNEVSSVIGLSGTPLTNRPIELWPILKVICPDLFPSLRKFAWRYCAPRFLFGRWLFDGAKHTKELNQILLEQCMIRRRKKDVLPMLPNKGRKVVSFKLRSYKEYDEAKNEFLLWLRRLSPMRAKRAARAEALVKIGYLTRLVAKLKLDWTVKWIGDFFDSNPGEKLVAFTMHTAIIDALQEKFANRCVVVDGRVTGRKREESIRQFRSHRKKDLFLGNWMAAGVGITLTSASNVAALDLPWTPGELIQGEDRCHRLTQKKDVTVHYLIALNTIEEKQMSVLQRKTKILNAVLDGERSSEDLDVFDELMKEIKKKI